MKIVNSAWKGRIGVPDVRKDRSCHCLIRLARTKGSDRPGGINRFVRPKECNGLRCKRPSVMRPEAQLSDPMNWDTSEYDKTVWEDIRHGHAFISRALDIGREASPDPGAIEARGTGYPELGFCLVQLEDYQV